jgi:hypothetical protein
MPEHRLPAGVKPPVEIARYPAADQIVFQVTLLEYLLRRIDGGLTDTRLAELIAIHGSKFTCAEHEIHKARWVRNQIIHGTGKATFSDISRAVDALHSAVEDILMTSVQIAHLQMSTTTA